MIVRGLNSNVNYSSQSAYELRNIFTPHCRQGQTDLWSSPLHLHLSILSFLFTCWQRLGQLLHGPCLWTTRPTRWSGILSSSPQDILKNREMWMLQKELRDLKLLFRIKCLKKKLSLKFEIKLYFTLDCKTFYIFFFYWILVTLSCCLPKSHEKKIKREQGFLLCDILPSGYQNNQLWNLINSCDWITSCNCCSGLNYWTICDLFTIRLSEHIHLLFLLQEMH